MAEQENNTIDNRVTVPTSPGDVVIPIYDVSEAEIPISGPWLAFIPNFRVWFSLWILMLIVLVILYAIARQSGLAVGIFTAVAYHYYAWTVIGKKERRISEFQERMLDIHESGPALVMKPLYNLRRDLAYPTGLQQLEFKTSAGVVTSAGEYKDPVKGGKDEKYESTLLGIEPVLYYMWPFKKDDLLKAAKNAPLPNDKKGLIDLFEEDILDVVRTTGGSKVWKDIMQNRLGFRDGATNLLRARIDYVIKLTKLIPVALVIKHADIAQTLKDQITAKEIARYEGAATRIKKREEMYGIAEGEEKLRKVLNEIMTNKKYKDTAKLVEAMVTIREAADKGKATYIALPAELYGTLGAMLGGQSPEKALGVSKEDLEQMLVRAVTKVVDKKFKQVQGGKKK